MPTDAYAVFGYPIGHSKSPRIHGLFAQQTGQDIVYSAQEVDAAHFESSVRSFFEAGGKGINCTVPLKELAFAFAERRSVRAERAKAVNTLMLGKDGKIYGDNTDGIGLIRDLTANLGLDLNGQDILLLGAGGASRGIIQPILEQSPRRLVVANRTVAKAWQLAEEFSDLGPLEPRGFAELAGESFDLALNATAASLSDELPDLPEHLLSSGSTCYDLAYGNQPTAFVRWGIREGSKLSVDGLGMLVEQAAEAFFIWRGVRPETRPVIDLLNSERKTS